MAGIFPLALVCPGVASLCLSFSAFGCQVQRVCANSSSLPLARPASNSGTMPDQIRGEARQCEANSAKTTE
ncbi:hypothetical protein BKA61DRAFT_592031 [Leptodontidium sp. MPI-SDFR-AT-0119]|nr:hypothetical protein BKA61DRAFT_592031 [Leptodontidium sp. MPI-SDFR-AT-0119]